MARLCGAPVSWTVLRALARWLEALSRGANEVWFVERSLTVQRLIKRNFAAVTGQDHLPSGIRIGDEGLLGLGNASLRRPFDVIFCDPPMVLRTGKPWLTGSTWPICCQGHLVDNGNRREGRFPRFKRALGNPEGPCDWSDARTGDAAVLTWVGRMLSQTAGICRCRQTGHVVPMTDHVINRLGNTIGAAKPNLTRHRPLPCRRCHR